MRSIKRKQWAGGFCIFLFWLTYSIRIWIHRSRQGFMKVLLPLFYWYKFKSWTKFFALHYHIDSGLYNRITSADFLELYWCTRPGRTCIPSCSWFWLGRTSAFIVELCAADWAAHRCVGSTLRHDWEPFLRIKQYTLLRMMIAFQYKNLGVTYSWNKFTVCQEKWIKSIVCMCKLIISKTLQL